MADAEAFKSIMQELVVVAMLHQRRKWDGGLAQIGLGTVMLQGHVDILKMVL